MDLTIRTLHETTTNTRQVKLCTRPHMQYMTLHTACDRQVNSTHCYISSVYTMHTPSSDGHLMSVQVHTLVEERDLMRDA